MNYYKIEDISLQRQIDAYMDEAVEADRAANAMAQAAGADGYQPSPYAEFGGIFALSFDHKAPRHFRYAGAMDGFKYYEPRVSVVETVEDEGFIRGLERRQSRSCWYDVKEITLRAARTLMTYNRAIELAHIKWEGTNLMLLAQQYRVSPTWIELYFQNRLPFANLCNKSKNYGLALRDREVFDKQLSEAMHLEVLLNDTLGKVRLYHVRTVKGPAPAVEFFRTAASLPIIPSGRLANLLGIKFVTDDVNCPAFFKSEGIWYIGTSGKIEDPDKATEISEGAYELAKMKRGEN